MKAAIHPKWYPEAKVTCTCGNTFTIGSTIPEIQIGVCFSCHPFYTGLTRFADTAGRVEKFKQRQRETLKKTVTKKESREQKRKKRMQAELSRPTSLEELRN